MALSASCSCLASGFGSGALADRIELDLASLPPTTNSTSPPARSFHSHSSKQKLTMTLDATRIRLVEGAALRMRGRESSVLAAGRSSWLSSLSNGGSPR